MSQLSFPHSNISRLRIGFTRNGTRVERNFRNDGNTTLVEVEPTASGCISGIETPDGTSDSHDPTIVVTIKDLSALVTAARDAEFSLKRFLELNERVTHAAYGAGTIRGFIQRNGELLWLVNFDRKPTIDTPDGAVAVPQLFPVASAQLQKA